jgi:hypothetical protein
MKKSANIIIGKNAQVSIFIIIAIIIIGLIGGYFLFKNPIKTQIPASIAPVYNYYTSCISDIVKSGANIMASQGGYLINPDFKPGSNYAPFSSELDFMGLGIPYWYYIAGNGVEKQQIPSKTAMQNQLANYISSQISNCNFEQFIQQGYEINFSNPSVRVSISEEKIEVSVNQRILIAYQDSSYILSQHNLDVSSRLGDFYETAKKIYNFEQSSLFLENYSLDALYTYVPVSGVNINCSPSIWNPYEVIGTLKNALSANIGAIKLEGGYYRISNKNTNYFISGKGLNLNLNDKQISFLYSGDWPSRFEVWPTESNVMIASPIGNQQGLGVLGFCYVPYKFVYDAYFPVLVQIYNPDNAAEIFQFPLAVVLNKNLPREAGENQSFENLPDICLNSNSEIQVSSSNINLEPIESQIEFKCFESICDIGSTKLNNDTGSAILVAKVPQCLNGILSASANGYKTQKQLISTNSVSSASFVLEKEYELNLEVYVDNVLNTDLTLLTITQNFDNITQTVGTVAYPTNKKIKLAEGDYTFDLKVYGSASINLPPTNTRQCVQTPKSGLLGIFGMQDEKCFDITVPGQTIGNVLSAGGYLRYYVLPSEMENSNILRLYARSVSPPNDINSVQINYDRVTSQKIDLQFA